MKERIVEHQRLVAASTVGLAALVAGEWIGTQSTSPLMVLTYASALITLVCPDLARPILYALVLASSVGVASFAPLFHFGPINGNDVLFVLLFFSLFPAYLQQRRAANSVWLHRLEFAWLVLILVLVIQAVRSPAASPSETVTQIQFVEGYLMFFPTVAMLSSRSRLKQLAIIGVVFAIMGTLLTIAQSHYGSKEIVSSPFYNTGAWPGSKGIIDGVVRVNLPVTASISFVLLILLSWSMVRPRWWYLPLGAFLLIALLISFARSLWLALIAASAVEVLTMLVLGRLRVSQALRVVVAPIMLLLSLLTAPYIGLASLADAIQERGSEGFVLFASGTGTWGTRLDQTDAALRLWASNPIWGVGFTYYNTFGAYIDLGLPLTLVSLGLVGLLANAFLVGVCCLAAAYRVRAARGLDTMVVAAAVPGYVVWIIVYQQWVTPYAFAVLGVASALATIGSVASETAEVTSPERTGARNGGSVWSGRIVWPVPLR